MGPLEKSQRDAGRPHNAAWDHRSIANINTASSSALAASLAASSSFALAVLFFLGFSDERCESFNFKAKVSWVLFIIVGHERLPKYQCVVIKKKQCILKIIHKFVKKIPSRFLNIIHKHF